MYVGIDYTSVLYVNSGPPRPCFGRKNDHSGSHITGIPLLLPQCSILQNPGKTSVLAVLPPVTSLQLVLLLSAKDIE